MLKIKEHLREDLKAFMAGGDNTATAKVICVVQSGRCAVTALKVGSGLRRDICKEYLHNFPVLAGMSEKSRAGVTLTIDVFEGKPIEVIYDPQLAPNDICAIRKEIYNGQANE